MDNLIKKYGKSIIIVILCFASISCNEQRNKNVIEFWTLQLSPTFNDYFNKIIADYENQNPNIKIKWVDIPYDVAIQKLLSAISADNAPDVINLSSDFLSKFDSFKILHDFSQDISIDSLKSIYLENALSTGIFNNRVIALPWYLNTYSLIYNKELLRQAEMDSVPSSFEEMIDFIKAYKRKTNKYAFYWNIGKDSFLPMMLESENIPMTSIDGSKALFNSREAKAKIRKWVQLYKDGYLPKGSVIESASSVVENYQSGRVAMIFTGPVFLNQIKTNSPQIYEVTEVASPLTGVTGKHELAAMSISVLKNSINIKEASKFALYVTNSKSQTEFSKLATIFPSTRESFIDEYFTSPSGDLESKARVMGAKLLPDAVRLRRFLLHPKFDLLKDSFEEAIQKSCLSGVDIDFALEKAVVAWNKILRED